MKPKSSLILFNFNDKALFYILYKHAIVDQNSYEVKSIVK